MPGSLVGMTRPSAPRTRRRRGSDIPQLHQLQRLGQQIGNRAVGRLADTATLPTKAAVESRLTGGRWFRRSEDQRRIGKWLDRWHATIAGTTPAIKMHFLEQFRALVVAYRDQKAAKQTSTTRATHISGLNTLIFEIDTVRTQVRTAYEEQDDLPSLTDLAGIQYLPDLATYGTAEPLGQGGLNTTYKVKVDTAGTEMVFKKEKDEDEAFGRHRGTPAGIPRFNPNQTGRAVATYRMAQLLGVDDVVPMTYYATYNGHDGQIMGLVQGVEGYRYAEMTNHRPEHMPDKRRIYWLDLICGQVDRHASNFMLGTDGTGQMTGRAFAIDNDLAFGEHYGIDAKKGTSRRTDRNASLDINGKQANELAITPELAERIIRLARNEALVRGALNGLLTTGEIDATINRLTNLASYLIRRLSKRDSIIGWDP